MAVNIRNKKKIVLLWLQSLEWNASITSPSHTMTNYAWFELFNAYHSKVYTTPIFKTVHKFSNQLNVIIDEGLFPALSRDAYYSTDSTYHVSYSIQVPNNPYRILCPAVEVEEETAIVSDSEDNAGTYASVVRRGLASNKCHTLKKPEEAVLERPVPKNAEEGMITNYDQHHQTSKKSKEAVSEIRPVTKKLKTAASTAVHSRSEQYIRDSYQYNLSCTVRPKKNSDSGIIEYITIHRNKKRLTESMKWSMVAAACDLGATSMNISDRERLFRAVIKTNSYFYGFLKPVLSEDYFRKLFLRFKKSFIETPYETYCIFEDKAGTGKQSYVEFLQYKYPTLLHKLFRYAVAVLGVLAETEVIVDVMNRKSKVEHPTCPIRSNLGFNTYHFWRFFHKNDGRLVHGSSVPRVTDEQIQQRVIWASNWLELFTWMSCLGIPVCFLDEKWFYTTSRRKKMKLLPRADFETEAEAFVPMPRLRNRRYALKVMCMGIVGLPVGGMFDGKIYMRRVSESYETQQNSYNQHISDLYEVNHALKKGQWKELFKPIHQHHDITVEAALDYIVQSYDLLPEVANHLCLSYKSHSKSGKTKKWVRLTKGYLFRHNMIVNKNGDAYPLCLEDLTLYRKVPSGTTVQRDTTCDSEFMLANIQDIGRAIRTKYYWIDEECEIYLVMDNAGGHGTNDTKEEYVRILHEEFNVTIVWQVPNSPESNMLDLGVWMTIQSQVERVHRTKVMRNDTLAESIEEAWDLVEPEKLTNIYMRWKKVLELIIKGKGDNQLVEKCRNKNEKVEDVVYVSQSDRVGMAVAEEESSDEEEDSDYEEGDFVVV